ncbi:MAG: OsmC family protein [Phycisphaerales bacterium JB059]
MSKTSHTDAASGVVVDLGRAHYRTEIVAGGHTLIADEPEAMGGANAGPGPYELLLSALGACKAMTVRMYADHKGWGLERVVLSLRHDRRHPADCEDCDDPKAKIDHIDVEIQLMGDLDEAQRARLLEIADRCPVHRTITGDLRVNSALVEG